MASPHPQPTAVAKLKGADKHNPQRYRGRAKEPKPELGIGECPDWLDGETFIVWKELEAEIAPGVLTRQDRQPFTVLCSLLAEFRGDPKGLNAAKLGIINSISQQFGMTPSSRTKVSTIDPETEKPENTFARFAPGLRAV